MCDNRTFSKDVVLRAVAVACLLALAGDANTASEQPLTLRLGYGTAAEEPLWLVVAKPDLAKNHGKAYALDAIRFTGSERQTRCQTRRTTGALGRKYTVSWLRGPPLPVQTERR